MLVSIKNLPRWTKASISITLGLLLGGALTYLFLRQKPKKATQDHGHGQSILDETSTPAKNKRILVLGLSGAGKSSILNRSKTKNETQEIKPTEGFNVICLQKPQMTLNIWEIGGSDKVKPYWANFIPNTNLLVFVIDSSSEDHLKASEKEFHKLMSDDRLNGVPILLLANKQGKVCLLLCTRKSLDTSSLEPTLKAKRESSPRLQATRTEASPLQHPRIKITPRKWALERSRDHCRDVHTSFDDDIPS